MARVEWDAPDTRVFEAGLERGMLYPPDSPGVPWNGLVSVDVQNTNSVEPVYFDGIKFNDLVTLGDFSGTLRAITYPDEFMPFDGYAEDQSGMYLTGQPQERFGLSYRTLIKNGFDELIGYKLNIVWNVTAMVNQRSYKTLALETEPLEFEWTLTAIPEDVAYHRPTAHLVFDSRHVDSGLLMDIEDILYGTDANSPTLPSLTALVAFTRKWERLIIVDNNDGTWSAVAKDPTDITMLSADEFEITADNVTYLDADTYEISSSDKNEEDIF